MSVTAAPGFVASGLHCGVKRSRPDLALIATEDGKPVNAAAVFTTNKFCAPSVSISRTNIAATHGKVSAVIVNSGNANAGNGPKGFDDANAMIAATAAEIGCPPEQVLICQTGLIGHDLPIRKILHAIPQLAAERSVDGGKMAARGILTTDSKPKRVIVEGDGFVVGGMGKGCGMLSPNMATMLGFLTTDAEASPELLHEVLSEAVADTFNALTVDGATSTNDTVILMASGKAGPVDRAKLAAAVREACQNLCLQMARDAEGATKLVTVTVTGASSIDEARTCARRICNNQLVKCSWHGGDPYWGRILSAAGSAGVEIDVAKAAVSYGGVVVSVGGMDADHDHKAVKAHMKQADIDVAIDLGVGEASARMFTVDLGPEYIRENSGTS
ncbi:MAG: bifunctional glutamate N-acetyltransferase/amino-acid acetyltransferase ArgJ [Caulobacteraceae bacterium]